MPITIDFARVWETKASSDVTLLIYPYHETGAASKPDPVATLPLHAVIVSSITSYFETQLHGACQGMGPEAEEFPQDPEGPEEEQEPPGDASGSQKRPGSAQKPPAKRANTGVAPQAAGKVLELTCFEGEPQSVPEAVMRHAYTGSLPDDPEVLAWMIRRADYLILHNTAGASLAKLQELSDGGQLTLQHVATISSLPGLSTLDEKYRAGVEQAVASMAAKVLQSQFGSTQQVLLDQQLLDQFVQLPFQLLKQWAMLDSLQVDSDNTMAVLMTAWYDRQLDSATPATEQQCKQLSVLLCLNKLTPSFHLQALPHLKWYRAPARITEQHAIARAVSVMAGVSLISVVTTALDSGGVAGRKQGPAKAEQQWSLSRKQLEVLKETHTLKLDSAIYLAGFSFTAQLSLTEVPAPEQPGQGEQPAVQQYTLSVYLQVYWPETLINHGVEERVPYPLAAVRIDVKAGKGGVSGPLVIGASAKGSSIGWLDVAKRQFSKVDELATFMLATQPCVSITLEAV